MSVEKPFQCTTKGCGMSFSASYFLSIHQQKHDMDLINLALFTPSKNTQRADETPTPTRFIRSCEEVGLFQDLQNVNPFDETFKKALENKENGLKYEPKVELNDEDPLNTPNILPHILPTPEAATPISDDDCSNFNIGEDVLEIVTSSEGEDDVEEEQEVEIIVENGKKSRNGFDRTEGDCNEQESEVVLVHNGTNKQTPINIYDKETLEVDKRREMNRLAQVRCRAKKKIADNEYINNMLVLRSENQRLTIENEKLRLELEKMRNMLSKHTNCMPIMPTKEIHKTVDIPVGNLASKLPTLLPATGIVLPKINSVGTLKGMVVVPQSNKLTASIFKGDFKIPTTDTAGKGKTFVSVKRTAQDKVVIIKKLKKI